MKKIILFGIFTFAVTQILAAEQAHAAVRRVYFSVVGRNSTMPSATFGSKAATPVRCVISVSNTSSQNQTVTISFTGSSADIGTAVVSGDYPALSGATLTANGGTNRSEFIFTYPISTTGVQTVTCAGYIEVSDSTPTQPGFITANGTLVTFTQSGAAASDNSTATSQHWENSLIYSQTPIPINAGKPF